MIHTVMYYTDSRDYGGAEQVLLTTLAGLDQQRWRPVLLHHAEPGIRPLLERAQELDIELWPVPHMPEGGQGAVRVPGLVRALRARHPDVFHANLTWSLSCKFGLLAAILARVPAVVATEHLFVDVRWSRSQYLQHRLVSTGVKRYIAVSHEVAHQLRRSFDIPAHKLQVVHSCIPITRFNRPANAALRSALTKGTGRPIILTTARLDKQKGHRYLLEAAALVPEAAFVLAGDGPERASLEAQVRQLELDDRVVFLGYRDDIPDLLATCDVLVLPSLYEGLGVALLEAMAAEKPVIASAIGGIDEVVVHGETGILVPPANPVALAEAIRALLSDPVLSRRLAAAGKARVHREFSAETMVQQVSDIYETLLRRRAA